MVVRLSGVRMLGILGIHVVSSKSFTCSLSNAKRSFYRSFNAIFGRFGHIASEAVIAELVNSKCLPTLLYGLEAYPLKYADLKSLDYTVVGAFMKFFKTKSKEVASCCMEDRDGVRIFFRILCTFIYNNNFIYNTTKRNVDEIPQQQQRSNTSDHSDSHDTSPRLYS